MEEEHETYFMTMLGEPLERNKISDGFFFFTPGRTRDARCPEVDKGNTRPCPLVKSET